MGSFSESAFLAVGRLSSRGCGGHPQSILSFIEMSLGGWRRGGDVKVSYTHRIISLIVPFTVRNVAQTEKGEQCRVGILGPFFC